MVKNSPIITPMCEDDLDDVVRSGEECFGVANRADFLSCISRSEVYSYFTLKVNSEVVGYYGIMHIAEDGELLTIAVLNKEQHKGYGELMMRSAKLNAELKGSKKIFLEVNEHNDPAIRLYTKMGFKTISKRAGYYGKDDAIIMQLDL